MITAKEPIKVPSPPEGTPGGFAFVTDPYARADGSGAALAVRVDRVEGGWSYEAVLVGDSGVEWRADSGVYGSVDELQQGLLDLTHRPELSLPEGGVEYRMVGNDGPETSASSRAALTGSSGVADQRPGPTPRAVDRANRVTPPRASESANANSASLDIWTAAQAAAESAALGLGIAAGAGLLVGAGLVSASVAVAGFALWRVGMGLNKYFESGAEALEAGHEDHEVDSLVTALSSVLPVDPIAIGEIYTGIDYNTQPPLSQQERSKRLGTMVGGQAGGKRAAGRSGQAAGRAAAARYARARNPMKAELKTLYSLDTSPRDLANRVSSGGYIGRRLPRKDATGRVIPRGVTYRKGGYTVKYDENGFADFSSYVYQGGAGRGTVSIKLTGNRAHDNAAANVKAGFGKTAKSTPKGFTWHHHQEVGVMQLVPSAVHGLFPHNGGVTVMNGLQAAAGNNPMYSK